MAKSGECSARERIAELEAEYQIGVNAGADAIKQLTADRDAWKARAEALEVERDELGQMRYSLSETIGAYILDRNEWRNRAKALERAIKNCEEIHPCWVCTRRNDPTCAECNTDNNMKYFIFDEARFTAIAPEAEV